jgi:hypothetical protein
MNARNRYPRSHAPAWERSQGRSAARSSSIRQVIPNKLLVPSARFRPSSFLARLARRRRDWITCWRSTRAIESDRIPIQNWPASGAAPDSVTRTAGRQGFDEFNLRQTTGALGARSSDAARCPCVRRAASRPSRLQPSRRLSLGSALGPPSPYCRDGKRFFGNARRRLDEGAVPAAGLESPLTV